MRQYRAWRLRRARAEALRDACGSAFRAPYRQRRASDRSGKPLYRTSSYKLNVVYTQTSTMVPPSRRARRVRTVGSAPSAARAPRASRHGATASPPPARPLSLVRRQSTALAERGATRRFRPRRAANSLRFTSRACSFGLAARWPGWAPRRAPRCPVALWPSDRQPGTHDTISSRSPPQPSTSLLTPRVAAGWP